MAASDPPCLICGQEGLDEQEMRSHMLAVHELTDVSCPFCSFGGVTAQEMTKHVNSCHLDVFSPVKQTLTSSTSHSAVTNTSIDASQNLNSTFMNGLTTDMQERTEEMIGISERKETDMEQLFTCPMCSAFVSDSPEVLNLHVNQYHFSEDNNFSVIPVESTSTTNKRVGQNVDYKDIECTDSNDKNNHVQSKDFKNSRDGDGAENKENVYRDDVRREDMSENVLVCPVCDAEMTHNITLEFHLNAAHPEFREDVEEAGLVLLCPMCGETATNAANLQSHVDTHFTDNPTTSTSGDSQLAQELERREKHASFFKQQHTQPQNGQKKQKPNQGNYGRGKMTNAQKNTNVALSRGQTSMLDFYARQKGDATFTNKTGVDDGSTATKGILQRLQAFYKTPSRFITGAWLASPTDHYCGSDVDRGWGCGYRNFQMMLSCLVQEPSFNKVLFNGKSDIPSVPKIQKLIEEAWERGFDPQGREQLHGRVSNTRKWIGATEIFAVFASLKVKCQLVDFYKPTGPEGTHPCLFQWVLEYFQKGGFTPPLYLQHQGHSRSIVGVEESKDGTLKLILFDPGTPRSQMQQFVRRDITPQLMRVIRRLPSGMKAKQYQILSVRGILTDREQQDYKLVKSARIP